MVISVAASACASDDEAATADTTERTATVGVAGQLDANDTGCTPSYISQDDFDAIVTSPIVRGNGR
jgi:hypothetical protein